MMVTGLFIGAMAFAVSGDFDYPKTVRDYAEHRVSYTNLGVAYGALAPGDVQRWAQLISASEAQVQFMQVQYVEFVRRHNALLDREAPRLLAASADVRIAYNEDGGRTVAHTERLEALCRKSERLRRLVEQIEQEYVDSLEPILTEEQAEWLSVLRHEASRRQLRTRLTTVRWVDLELRPIWAEVEPMASLDNRADVAVLLRDYESSLTMLMRRVVAAHCELPVRTSRLLVEAQAGTLARDEFESRYDRVRSQYVRTLQAIAELNRNSARQIAEMLDDDLAEQFMQRARTTVFPELYSDHTAIHDLFYEIIHDEELDVATREVAAEVRNGYLSEYGRTSAKLEEFCTAWGEQAALGRDGYQLQYLQEALQPMLQQRRELSQQWRQRLAETIGEDVIERLGLDLSEPEEPEIIEERPSRDRPPF